MLTSQQLSFPLKGQGPRKGLPCLTHETDGSNIIPQDPARYPRGPPPGHAEVPSRQCPRAEVSYRKWPPYSTERTQTICIFGRYSF